MTLDELLAGSPVAVGDGAMGTMLQAAGLPLGTAADRWTLEYPDRVTAVHRAYVAAGARWLQTNTFGANRARLALVGLEEQVVPLNAQAVECARAVPGTYVLGSVGPAALAFGEWDALYAEQCGALAAAGVDGFMVETIIALGEGIAAVRAAADTGRLVLASYTPGAEGNLLDGTPAEVAARALVRAGASVVGVNCGAGPETLMPAVVRLVTAGEAPVLAAPNAGLPEMREGRACYGLTPDAFARAAIKFREAGARLIAGCCGTTPEHLRAAVSALSPTTFPDRLP